MQEYHKESLSVCGSVSYIVGVGAFYLPWSPLSHNLSMSCFTSHHLLRWILSPETEASVLTSRHWGLRQRGLHTVRQPSVIEQDEGVGVTTTPLWTQGHSSGTSRLRTSPERWKNHRALMWFSVLLTIRSMGRFLFPLIWLQSVDWQSSSTRKG